MLYIDPNGDTISYSSAFSNDEYAMKVANYWLNDTEAGKVFSSYYSAGGEYGHINVKIGYMEELPGYNEAKSGHASGQSVVMLDGEELQSGKNYGEYGQKNAKFGGQGKLEFNIGLRLGSETSNQIDFSDDLNTIIHETQHSMFDHYDLLNKRDNRYSSQHHTLMGDKNKSPYSLRYRAFFNSVKDWKKVNLKNETIQEYISRHINYGTGYNK